MICGAGIGGLTAAIALRKVGVDVTVYERVPEIRGIGAGISLWANAMKALRALGLADRIAARGFPLGKMLTKNRHGRVLNRMDVGAMSAAHGHASVCIHRADLQAELLAALPAGVVISGRGVIGVAPDESGVSATFEGGHQDRADILIGADGIRSAVRAATVGGGAPIYAGYTAWRGIAPIPSDIPEDELGQLAMGPACQVAFVRCGPDRLYWFITDNAPEGGGAGEDHRATALACLDGWEGGGPYRQVIASTPSEHVLRNDVYSIEPLSTWGRGRVTLLGDAAHATTPNLGQGGCMAIEDALAIAAALRGVNDPVPALRAYEESRLERTTYVIEQSKVMGFMLQLENPIAVYLRDYAMTLSMSTQRYGKLMDVLLAYEPPSLA